MELPSLDDIYPHGAALRHHGEPMAVGLRVVKGLEARGIMVNQHFHLDVMTDPDRVLVRFKAKRNARLFKDIKKELRDEEQG